MSQLDYNLIRRLDAKFGSPFYIMDGEKYRENVRQFLGAFRMRYDKVKVGYSFKTNYVPALCLIAKSEGCFAEVVSEMEYELAKKVGFDRVIFNGPIKRPHIFKKALEQGAIINLDSEYEVDMVCDYKQEHPFEEVKVGMRININLTDENGNSTIQSGLRFGRFGFPTDIIEKNLNRLYKAGVRVIALHGHTSSSDRAVLNYRIITQHMLNVCESYKLNDLEYFDIGGGFFGAAPDGMDVSGKPTYEDYANCVIDELEKSSWFMLRKPFIVIEPGSSVVSNVFSYFTKVYQNKKVGKVNFVMVDGTVFDVKPTMHSTNQPYCVYRAVEKKGGYTCDVVGSTCMEKDVILKNVDLPSLEAGDFICFNGVGAYTLSLTPTFINFLEPVITLEKGEYVEVRRRQNVDDIISIYRI